MDWQLPDLKSRMRSLPSQTVELPDDELLLTLQILIFKNVKFRLLNQHCDIFYRVLNEAMKRLQILCNKWINYHWLKNVPLQRR